MWVPEPAAPAEIHEPSRRTCTLATLLKPFHEMTGLLFASSATVQPSAPGMVNVETISPLTWNR